MNYIGIIPARYASTRFPGKPLAMIAGKPMIQRVYEQARKALDSVVVATDDSRIYDAVLNFGGEVVMTSQNHKSGTDRCWEAFVKISENSQVPLDEYVVINIQGDEPFIDPLQIELVKAIFEDKTEKVEIATLVSPFTRSDSIEDLLNPNTPKVAVSSVNNNALYFSRSVIPFLRGVEQSKWIEQIVNDNLFYRHIGMYAYRADILKQLTALEQTKLEKTESLEQLRWLENGYKIKVASTDIQTHGIDTPEDIEKTLRILGIKD